MPKKYGKNGFKKGKKNGPAKAKKRVQQRWNQAQKVEDIRVFVRNII